LVDEERSGSFSLINGAKKDSLLDNKLSALQQEILTAFFKRENRFFLTGGAALAGFYLGHRETHDLDLFTQSDALDDGIALVAEIAREMGGTLESIHTAPDFRRVLLTLGSEAVIIDLVRDRVPQISSQKRLVKGIRVDEPEEILANKLCALLSRSEIRDLVDVRALEWAGYRVEDAVPSAARKDEGLTPAQLSWVLKQMELGDDLKTPEGLPVEELRNYLADLVGRLALLAFPPSKTED
jgi:hypothetical protein